MILQNLFYINENKEQSINHSIWVDCRGTRDSTFALYMLTQRTTHYGYTMLDTLVLAPPRSRQSVGSSLPSPPVSVFVSLVGLVAQGVPEVLVGVEGAGQLVDVVVGADGAEVLHIVPEVRGGEGPVGHGRRLVVRHCGRNKGHRL